MSQRVSVWNMRGFVVVKRGPIAPLSLEKPKIVKSGRNTKKSDICRRLTLTTQVVDSSNTLNLSKPSSLLTNVCSINIKHVTG